jgi:hypothetical protein
MRGRFGAAAAVLLAGAAPVWADELPSRKDGLWEIKATMERPNGGPRTMTSRTCVDAAVEKVTKDIRVQAGCDKDEVKQSGDTFTVDAVCRLRGPAGGTGTYHAVTTGSFDSAYTATETWQAEGAPVAMTMKTEARWLGPCAADQKPGDVITSDGRKQNILDRMQNRGAPQDAPK